MKLEDFRERYSTLSGEDKQKFMNFYTKRREEELHSVIIPVSRGKAKSSKRKYVKLTAEQRALAKQLGLV